MIGALAVVLISLFACSSSSDSDDQGLNVTNVLDNEIYYTSNDKKVVQPHDINQFGAEIISNEYKDGMGVITFDGDVTKIGYRAFSECKNLTNIIIPGKVKSIEFCAFEDCENLLNITIPEEVKTIETKAFNGCTSLTSINIPASVETIEECAFVYCKNLTTITVDKGNKIYDSRNNCNAIIETATNTLLAGCGGTIIPEGVKTIGTEAFWGCTSLTNINIPENVETINGNAFRGCTSLTSISVDEGNKIYDSRNNCNAIIETATNTLLVGCGFTSIPEGVKNIADYAFYDCEKLASINIPASVKTIGENAFAFCENLNNINFSEGVEMIEKEAFRGCKSLKTLNIPRSATIAQYAFCECTGLTDVTVAWDGKSLPTVSDKAFDDVGLSKVTLHVPAGTKSLYEGLYPWNEFGNIVEY